MTGRIFRSTLAASLTVLLASLLVLIPLLAVAAILEAYVTPLVAALFL